ncbi:N-acetyl-gamma-glutamyl-phosphate reductase [Gossypium arboreum]|uniref:Uncharacterized protein n=2 Tax=Gossypium arboreum TaxID=29729 RepID=A0ABR0QGE4_GOSAR|nr:uncharacterized protein LOC108476428 [Gossypium arboreum]XP_052881433.1 uncharacterized protein LOC108476428 [Gossypium arboreum]KAK5838318.1 hypothetical protein PVK06_007047 [Gossypium arboreum]KHG15409.1 N-acetyl-gamma-glutamyl-phosphate reductase [Gossypium arboreum]
MGGGLLSHKGNGSGNGHKGRPYVLMLLLAFGAALLGVMVLHKFREIRIFNLLIEDKNRQLLSLQLLLQKEREYTKDMRRKAEETKAKIYYLRNQKMELDRRLLDMLSTLDSLKDEQKAMESALEEKKREIKLLRDKDLNTGNENPQIIALTATLKQKEAEIEELKHHLTGQVRVWSVSTDDPSNPKVNMTKGKTEFSREESRRVHESSYKGGHNSPKGQDATETKFSFSQEEDKGEGFEDGSEKRGGQQQKLESLGENANNHGAIREMKIGDTDDTGNYVVDGKKNHANAIDTINDVDNEQEKRISFSGQLEKRRVPHLESERIREGGKKMDIDENSRISSLPGRIGHLSRSKGKRWRSLARKRLLKRNVNSRIDAVENMTGRRLSKENKALVRSKEDGAGSGEPQKDERDKTEKTGPRKEMGARKANLFKHRNSEDTEDMSDRKVSAKTSHQVEGENAMQRNHDDSLAMAIQDTGVIGEASNYTQGTNHVKVEEGAKIKQIEGHETEEDIEVAYEQEPKTEAEKGDLSSNYMSESDGKEGNKDDTNEPHF